MFFLMNIFSDFGDDSIKIVGNHYLGTLMEMLPDFDVEESLRQWHFLKNLLYKR